MLRHSDTNFYFLSVAGEFLLWRSSETSAYISPNNNSKLETYPLPLSCSGKSTNLGFKNKDIRRTVDNSTLFSFSFSFSLSYFFNPLSEVVILVYLAHPRFYFSLLFGTRKPTRKKRRLLKRIRITIFAILLRLTISSERSALLNIN